MTEPAPPRSRLLILHNPSAGLARQTLLGDVDGALRAAGAAVRLESVDGIAESRRLLADALCTRAYDAVIAAGGDSTIRIIAAELAGTGVPLGVVPVGTGNVLAEELWLPRSPGALARYILGGGTVEVVPGMANGELFLSMASAGFDAGVLKRLDVNLKRRIGKLAYAWPIMGEIWSRQQRLEVLVDDRPYTCSWLIAMRGAHYAGSFVIAPRQRLIEPRLTALLIDAEGLPALATILAAMALGRADRHPRITALPCRRVVVPGSPAAGLQLDGEPVQGARLDVELASMSLQLIVPEPP